MTPRRVALLALLAGLLVGALLAVALPRAAPLRAGARAITSPPSSAAGPRHRRGDPRFEVRPGSVRLALVARDPAGAAPWAVRLIESRAVVDRFGGGTRALAWTRCAQLGRMVAGRFGWITQARGFTPVPAVAIPEVPETCQTPRVLAGRNAATSLVTLVRADAGGHLAPAHTIAFGRLGARTRSITLTDRNRPVAGRTVGQAFLAFARADPGIHDLRLRIAFAGLPAIDRDLSGTIGAPRPSGPLARHQGRPVAGTERVVARTPDPAGGAPYGLLAVRSSRPGQFCVGQPTQILGARAGSVDNHLELFRAQASGYFCGDDRFPLTRRRPLQTSLSTGGAQLGQEAPGRLLRRSLAGSSVLAGTAWHGVRSIEVTTSRDQRTLQPDRTTGAFITAYDGNFPGETIAVTATLPDGTRSSVKLAGGG